MIFLFPSAMCFFFCGGLRKTRGATEARRAWLLSQVASLAEGLRRRRFHRGRRHQHVGGCDGVPDGSAAAAATRAGRLRRDVAADALEATETAALFPRLRYLVEDIAGLPDCFALEEKGVTDSDSFAPVSLRLPHSRAVLSRALRAHLELDPEFFQPPLGTALTALLEDTSGGVRRAAGRDVARVLALFDGSDQSHILHERILARLPLGVPLPPDGAPGPATSAPWRDVDGGDLGGDNNNDARAGAGAGAGGGSGAGDGAGEINGGVVVGGGGGEMSAAARARAAEAAARARGDADGGGSEEDRGGGTDDDENGGEDGGDRMDDDGAAAGAGGTSAR